MKLELTVTLGDLLVAFSACVTLIGASYAVIKKFNKMMFYFVEFPPHRHVNTDGIIYPKGMHPDEIKVAAKKAGA